MFSESFLEELAEAVARKLATKIAASGDQWPAVMSLDTAGDYIDRTGNAVRGLVKAGDIKAVRCDSKIQVRRIDLDSWAERHAS